MRKMYEQELRKESFDFIVMVDYVIKIFGKK